MMSACVVPFSQLLGDPLSDSNSSLAPDDYASRLKKQSLPRRIFGHPVLLLVFLSLLALMNYYDRGAFTGIIPVIGDEFNMTDSQKGIIGGAFIGAAPLLLLLVPFLTFPSFFFRQWVTPWSRPSWPSSAGTFLQGYCSWWE